MIFSERLRNLLEEREITQKRLAEDLQIPASTLGGYVQGTSEPDFEILKRIAQYFHVSADFLLDLPDRQTQSGLEADLLRVFRTLTPEQQEIYLEQGKVFIRRNAKKEPSASIPPVKREKRR